MAYPTTLVYQITTPVIGAQPIATTSTTKLHPYGTIIRANETTVYGEGEFIYLLGVANTAAGQVVAFNGATGVTELLVDDGKIGPVAIAMSANVASQYGWYQISGQGPVKYLTNSAIDLEAYVTATAGSVSSDIVSGDVISGMNFKGAADSAGSGYTKVQLSRPFVVAV